MVVLGIVCPKKRTPVGRNIEYAFLKEPPPQKQKKERTIARLIDIPPAAKVALFETIS